jgi:Dolichyl-phosphate-mannose-protein mannosyltransferase
MNPERRFWIAALCVTLVGLVLRLKGIHTPIFDHPGWRQGDTAAIARNFATLRYNPLFPQTDYDGPPPNYVELELQIVPFLAATLYKLFGVHEVFGRLLSIAFGVGTIPIIALFGRWLFTPHAASRHGDPEEIESAAPSAPRPQRAEPAGAPALAGLAAAATFAILPGAWYYSHTFMPDTAMVFFTTCALYACGRWIVDEKAASWRGFWPAALLLAAAFLAKPVAVTAAIPLGAAAIARLGWRGALARPQLWALVALAFVPLAAYDRFVSAHAEWHWASGITTLHVIPSLKAALTSTHAFVAKAGLFREAIGMLATTMLGPVAFVLAIAGLLVPLRSRSDALVWGWLAGGLLYAYVVVTVERVDYYLYLLLPLGALLVGHLVDAVARRTADLGPQRRLTLAGIGALIWVIALVVGYRQIAPYYHWNHVAYVRAKHLDATLAPGALVVMGHYDPSILYTINRKGWEEDPHLWTPFDEQSAIRKGARYYISIEHRRLKATNLELYCWLSRFPVLDPAAAWPVYVTDPAKVLPGAEERWRAFRKREMAGAFANWQREWKTEADPCR